jgi:hypothetical protein
MFGRFKMMASLSKLSKGVIAILFCMVLVSVRLLSYVTKNMNISKATPFSPVLKLSSQNLTVADLSNDEFSRHYLDYIKSHPIGPNDVIELYSRLRLLRDFYLTESDGNSPQQQSSFVGAQEVLYKDLFPWLKMKSLKALQQSYDKPRGIVIPAGNKFFSILLTAIKIIRHYGCQLPIEIFYMGPSDLSNDRVLYLQSLPHVTTVDITKLLDIHHPKLQMVGWFIKPFAILLSRFREVLLLDADVVFMQDPKRLFATKQYRQTGAGFFYDRQLARGTWPKQYSKVLHEIMPQPYAKNLQTRRIFQATSEYEMDSGVIVYDKQRHFASILLACLLNAKTTRKFMQFISMGDKETFWYAMDMLYEDYAFLDHVAGTVGNPRYGNHTKDDILCGTMAHFDDVMEFDEIPVAPGIGQGKLFWFQDSVLLHKREVNDHTFIDYTHSNHENKWGPIHHEKQCSAGNKTALTSEEIAVMNTFKSMWAPDKLSRFKVVKFERPTRRR